MRLRVVFRQMSNAIDFSNQQQGGARLPLGLGSSTGTDEFVYERIPEKVSGPFTLSVFRTFKNAF